MHAIVMLSRQELSCQKQKRRRTNDQRQGTGKRSPMINKRAASLISVRNFAIALLSDTTGRMLDHLTNEVVGCVQTCLYQLFQGGEFSRAEDRRANWNYKGRSGVGGEGREGKR